MAREDLITQAQRSPEERRAIARAGGKARGAQQKRQKQTRELIKVLLAATPQLTTKQVRQLEKAGIDPEGVNIEALSLIAIANKAMAGDLASAKFLYDYAQVPDIRLQLEKERLKLAQEAKSEARDTDKVTVVIDV